MAETIMEAAPAIEVDELHHLAAAPLAEHADNHGLSAVSGCALPCKRAVLAGHALAL
jgi:hypothetical protein